METKNANPGSVGFVEAEGKTYVAVTQLKPGAVGLAGAVMQNVIPLGVCLMELARTFPSAGGYFTYVSQTLGPVMGFLTAWVFVLYSPIAAGPSLAVLGQILQDELATNYGITWFHWWYAPAIGIPLAAW